MNPNHRFYIVHGPKFISKLMPVNLPDTSINFILIDSPEQIKQYTDSVFIFDAQLLQKAPFEQWTAALTSSITLSEQHLQLDTDLIAASNFPQRETIKILTFACRQLLSRQQYMQAKQAFDTEHQRISQLNKIAIALSTEKNIGVLLRKILHESQNLSDCDAVSLYLVNQENTDNPSLIFKLSFNDTLDSQLNEMVIPLNNHSIAGYAALNNQAVVINDVYHIDADKPYQFDSSLDQQLNYRTISMLAVPITNHKHEAIGVLQFINRKSKRHIKLTSTAISEKYVLPFDPSMTQLLCALASQAAIAIENALLIENINKLFEGFVQASVLAIEQRDPTTCGHSFRVADLCISLATQLHTSDNPNYRQIKYSDNELRELRYAALLHDFGKVGVRENVLIKEKKLPDKRLELLEYRFALEKERLQRKMCEQELHLHQSHASAKDIDTLHKQLKLQLTQLDQYFQAVVAANEPTILSHGHFFHLNTIKKIPFDELNNTHGFLISDKDFLALSVKKGSLTENERQQIQSHVVHTMNFLEQIPWTADLQQIPSIAAAHHEKLNGQGYPYGLFADEISMTSRIMAVCDIYDALIAKDRPYKDSVAISTALNIIQAEADGGALDKELVKIFIQQKVYKLIHKKDYQPSMNINKNIEHNPVCDIDLN